MPRQRMVRPTIMKSESLSEVSHEVRYFFVLLSMVADDQGRFRVNLRVLVKEMYPLDDWVTEATLKSWLEALEGIDSVRFYTDDCGKIYGYIPNFKIHQKINRPSESAYPEPCKCAVHNYSLNESLNHSVSVAVNNPVNDSVNGSQRKKERRKEENYNSSFVVSDRESAANNGALSHHQEKGVSLSEYMKMNPGEKVPGFLQRMFGVTR